MVAPRMPSRPTRVRETNSSAVCAANAALNVSTSAPLSPVAASSRSFSDSPVSRKTGSAGRSAVRGWGSNVAAMAGAPIWTARDSAASMTAPWPRCTPSKLPIAATAPLSRAAAGASSWATTKGLVGFERSVIAADASSRDGDRVARAGAKSSQHNTARRARSSPSPVRRAPAADCWRDRCAGRVCRGQISTSPARHRHRVSRVRSPRYRAHAAPASADAASALAGAACALNLGLRTRDTRCRWRAGAVEICPRQTLPAQRSRQQAAPGARRTGDGDDLARRAVLCWLDLAPARATRSRSRDDASAAMTQRSKPTSPFVVAHDDAPAAARLKGAVAAIGNFDGVHRGHGAVIEAALSRAVQIGAPAIAVTFEPHPRNVLRPTDPVFRLTGESEKLRLLAATGLSGALVLTFNAAFAAQTAEEFVSRTLVGRLGIRGATIGFDFHFGHQRGGSPAFLAEQGLRYGFSGDTAPPLRAEARPLSSSSIRAALTEGRLVQAAELLGYPWFVSGTLIQGDQRGRTL